MYYADDDSELICTCLMETCTLKTETGFLDGIGDEYNGNQMYFKPSFLKENNRVSGFFGSCTPLDAVLMADFSCFYNETCLNLLLNYFPRLTKVIDTILRMTKIVFFYYLFFSSYNRKCYSMHHQ
jgi:hypothetical protein